MTFRNLRRFVEALPSSGSFSLWAGPLDGPPWVTHRDRERHYAASTMKLALVIAGFRAADDGRLDLDSLVDVRNSFRSVSGAGRFELAESDDSDPEPWRRLGGRVALRWLAYRSIVRSSNLATNLLLDAVGVDAVVAALRSVGAHDSVVARGIDDAPARDAGLENLVTARDLALTLQSLVAGRAASRESCDEILSILAAQQVNDGLPAGLPVGTRVAHKSGWVEGISHDAGIVYPPDAPPVVIAVCTSSGLDAQAGLDVIAAAAEAAWADRRLAA